MEKNVCLLKHLVELRFVVSQGSGHLDSQPFNYIATQEYTLKSLQIGRNEDWVLTVLEHHLMYNKQKKI